MKAAFQIHCDQKYRDPYCWSVLVIEQPIFSASMFFATLSLTMCLDACQEISCAWLTITCNLPGHIRHLTNHAYDPDGVD